MGAKLDPKVAEKIMLKARLKPLEPYKTSGVKWKCECLKCGRIVYPIYNKIQSGAGGCKYCAIGQYVNPIDAEALMLRAGLKPLEPYKGSGVKWKCKHLKCGNTIYPTYSHIKSGRTGCAYCSGSMPIEPKKAEKLMLNNDLKPLEPYKNSKTKWKCECLKCGKTVYPIYSSIQGGAGGCAYCAGRKVDATDAEKIMLKAGLKPLEPYKKNNTKWKCECLKCGKIVYPIYSSIQGGGGGCRDCWFESTKNDAEFTTASMIKAGVKPLEPYKGSGVKWKCECLKCGKTVYPIYSSIQRGGGGCKYCSWKLVDSKDAEALMLKANLKPLEPYKDATSKWKCECLKCGKTVYPIYNTIQQGHGGCIFCGGAAPLDPKKAENFMIKMGYRPKTPYLTTATKWECIHIPCGKIVKVKYSQIKTGQGGCRTCADWGFQIDKQSYLYLITHKDFVAHKVGIANLTNSKYQDRLYRLKKEGWEKVQVWNFEDGSKIIEIETSIFKILRKDLGIPKFLAKEQMKNGGETETMDAELISLPDLKRIINNCIKKGLQE